MAQEKKDQYQEFAGMDAGFVQFCDISEERFLQKIESIRDGDLFCLNESPAERIRDCTAAAGNDPGRPQAFPAAVCRSLWEM